MQMHPPHTVRVVTGVWRGLRRAVLLRRRWVAALLAAMAAAAVVQLASAPPAPTTPVWTAARDLAAGTVVGPEDLTRARFRPGSVPEGALVERASAVGRSTTGPVRAGEPITDVRLLGRSLLAGYPDAVATPVRIPDAGAVDLLRVGDRVDLVAADPQGAQDARVVASDVPVIALPEPHPDTAAGPLQGRLVVLATTRRTARDLAAAGVSSYLSVLLTR